MTESEPHVVVPDWMTPEQVGSISDLFKRNPDGAANQAEFFHRVKYCFGGYAGIQWCGMFVGIETDGHSHT